MNHDPTKRLTSAEISDACEYVIQKIRSALDYNIGRCYTRCAYSGCSNESWERPDGTKMFCVEHEEEQYRLRGKRNTISLL